MRGAGLRGVLARCTDITKVTLHHSKLQVGRARNKQEQLWKQPRIRWDISSASKWRQKCFFPYKKQQLQFHCSPLPWRLLFKPLLRRALAHLKPKFGTPVTVSRLARKCSCNVVIHAMQTFTSVYPPRAGLGFQQPADGRQETGCWQYLSQPQIFVSLAFHRHICPKFTCLPNSNLCPELWNSGKNQPLTSVASSL